MIPEFKKVDQAVLTNREAGIKGDCLSACVATILGMELKDVPIFIEMPLRFWYDNYILWIFKQGYKLNTKWSPKPEDFPVDTLCIATGLSPRSRKGGEYEGLRHAVVYCNNELVHDPHPEKNGILDLQSIEWFTPLTENDKIIILEMHKPCKLFHGLDYESLKTF